MKPSTICVALAFAALAGFGTIVVAGHRAAVDGNMCARYNPCDDIAYVQRQRWDARPARDTKYQHELPVPYAIVHHTVTGVCRKKSACARIIANLQTFHMDHLNYDDIAYK